MERVSPTEAIDLLLSSLGKERAAAALKSALKRYVTEVAGETNVQEHMKNLGCRPEYDRMAHGGALQDIEAAREVIRRVKLPFEWMLTVDYCPRPWNLAPYGSRVKLVFGAQRLFPKPWDQTLSVHAEDSLAGWWVGKSLESLGRKLVLESHMIEATPSITNEEFSLAARWQGESTRLEGWIRDRTIGGVVIIGSPLSNPMAEAFLRMHYSQQAEVPFSMHSRLKKGEFDSIAISKWGVKKEVVNFNGETYDVGTTPKPRKKTHFDRRDAGIVLLDVTRIPVVLCAGLGSLGTLATTKALDEFEEIERLAAMAGETPAAAVITAEYSKEYIEGDAESKRVPLPEFDDVIPEFHF